MKLVLGLSFIFAFAVFSVVGKVFAPCELYQELKQITTDKELLRNWMCLVDNESKFKTNAKNVNTNGSTDYGLFQINDKFWCAADKAGKDCNIMCSKLMDDSIADDINCAKIIYKRHGFTAWVAWTNYCKNNAKALAKYDNCK
uniref:lysozyme n=1 Tax=Corethrella appendiculata TaxID=1370023 RepID=U5EQF8_9DIPT